MAVETSQVDRGVAVQHEADLGLREDDVPTMEVGDESVIFIITVEFIIALVVTLILAIAIVRRNVDLGAGNSSNGREESGGLESDGRREGANG